jgi:hypothetical protein
MATLKNTIVNDIGFLQLPAGTTAERLNAPIGSIGEMRFNTSLNRVEFYDGSNWIGSDEYPGYITNATGGSVSWSNVAAGSLQGNYKVHVFNSTENFTINAFTGCPVIEYLIVAGGGAGGYLYGGGGGAGGMITGKTDVNFILNNGTGIYTVTVGGGASAPGSATTQTTVGGDSSVFGVIAHGGGGGAHGEYTNDTTNMGAKSGGSGGGGGSTNSIAPVVGGAVGRMPGKGIGREGNPGSNGNMYGGNQFRPAAGGGGAGFPGDHGYTGNGPVGGGGAGGQGRYTNITGSDTIFAGGGGGGSGAWNGAVPGGAGGGGYGGGGGITTPSYQAANGDAAKGGGGGGGGDTAKPIPGSGGSGVVILKYRFS